MVNRRSQPSSAISCLAGSYLLVGTCASAQITVEGNQSVQSAIDKAPAGGAVTVIAPGTYREVLEITRANITLRGSSKNASATVDVFDKSACDSGGTSQSATVNIRADGFTTESITFANDWNGTHTQSQAGSQALYSGKGRQYFVDSYIKGNVDLIFGDARAFFNYRKSHSTLHAVGGYITAQSRIDANEDSAYVFDPCKLTAEPGQSEDRGALSLPGAGPSRSADT